MVSQNASKLLPLAIEYSIRLWAWTLLSWTLLSRPTIPLLLFDLYIALLFGSVSTSNRHFSCTKHAENSCLLTCAYVLMVTLCSSVKGRSSLSSASAETYVIHGTRLVFGQRSLTVAGLSIWNSLYPSCPQFPHYKTISNSKLKALLFISTCGS